MAPLRWHRNEIAAAAIRLIDGRIFTGPTHCQAYMAAEDAGVDLEILAPGDCSGYVRLDGSYLSMKA